MMKRKWVALFMSCSLLVGAGGTYVSMNWLQKGTEHQTEIEENITQSEIIVSKDGLQKVEQAYELILNQFIEKVDEEQLIEGAIQGMLASLEDPHSVYMDKKTTQRFNESLESSFEGIGAEVSMIEGKIIIVSPFKDSPAEKAGLKPKDQIVSIDGKSVEDLDLFEATLKIRGEKGTAVKLEIIRNDTKDRIVVEVIRDEIPFETVASDLIEENEKRIGYIEISSFSEDTAVDFKKQLRELEKKRIAGLVIDVRGNPGGLLSSVQEISKELITDQKPFVQTETRNGKKNRFFSTLKQPKKYPIAVLIDGGSASASEILAAALHEAEGYELVGEKTFGKGTVQHPVDMKDGSSIKLTSLKWLTPDGNWIHQNGIEPSVKVKQPRIFQTLPIQAEQTLTKDMNNEQVKHAQEILQSIGFEPGRTDGYFSMQTEIAVRAFQQAQHIEVSGEIDNKTIAALEEAVMREMRDRKNDLQLRAALKIVSQ